MSWSASALVGGFVALLTENSHWFGLTERALGAVIVCWLVIIGAVSRRPVVRVGDGERGDLATVSARVS